MSTLLLKLIHLKQACDWPMASANRTLTSEKTSAIGEEMVILKHLSHLMIWIHISLNIS